MGLPSTQGWEDPHVAQKMWARPEHSRQAWGEPSTPHSLKAELGAIGPVLLPRPLHHRLEWTGLVQGLGTPACWGMSSLLNSSPSGWVFPLYTFFF